MSLTTCIRKAGDSLNPEDKAAILEAAAKNRKAGMKAGEAAKAAVEAQIAAVEAMLSKAAKAEGGNAASLPGSTLNFDRIADTEMHVGDLKRDRKYDAPGQEQPTLKQRADSMRRKPEGEAAEAADTANKRRSIPKASVLTPAGSIKAAATDSKAPSSLWYYSGDIKGLQFTASVVVNGQPDPRAAEAKATLKKINAAQDAGWRLGNYRAGSLGTVWVFEKDGDFLSRAGMDNADSEVTAWPDIPSYGAGYDNMVRGQREFAAALDRWLNTLPAEQQANQAVVSRKMDEVLGGWAGIERDKLGLHVRYYPRQDDGKRVVGWLHTISGSQTWEEARARIAEMAGFASPAADTPAPAEQSASTFDYFKATMRAVYDGTASVEDYKAAYRRVRDADAVKAELGKLTKDELIRTFGIMARPDEKKDSLIATAYKAMLRGFALGKQYGPSSYSMTRGGLENYERLQAEALDAIVENHTADDLAAYAAEVKAERDEKLAKRAALAEAVQDPKTLDDFRSHERLKMSEGMTPEQARMSLTPEQRANRDALLAESSRARRNASTDDQRTQVRVAGQTVDGNIIATKHTKKGHDLYVVQLAERVSREDYETLNAGAKKIGGYYSSFRGGGAIPGFQFNTREQAQAFVTLAGGDATAAKEAAQERRDAYADDRSQTAAERLTEMAEAMDAAADESLSRERKANTERRARFAAAAEAGAREAKAMAKTMRNVAQALTSGTARFLDRVRTKTQVELLQTYVANAKGDELRAKYPTYAEQEKRKGQPPTMETADYAVFPEFTAFRSDLASLGRQLQDVDGTKKIGDRLMKVADDVSDAFTAWVKEPGNYFRVAAFSSKNTGERAGFPSKDAAERAIARSGYRGKAIPWSIKRGEWTVIMSPSEAVARGLWTGDGDKRITLTAEFGAEMVESIGRANRRGAKVSVPWQFERAYERRKQLSRMGIETPAEFRAALREFIGLREQAAEADRVKMLERAMVGKAKDGLDFFPTPESVADEMVAAANLEPGMRVLEPSAGMGHIADRIRAAGAEPEVVEFASDRRELLEAKGFNVVGQDFIAFTDSDAATRGFTFGDVFRAPDGTLGVLRGSNGMGGSRVGLDPLDANGQPDPRRSRWESFSELEPVEKRGASSGYDRILMNPPFSAGRDIEHVRHAYTLLKPGGRIVALMGESAFTNQNKRATEFREWLESVGGTEEKLPEGSFMDPSLPVNTGANARMVVIDKPENGQAATPLASRANPLREFGFVSPRTLRDEVAKIVANWDQDLADVEVVNRVEDLPADIQQAVRNVGSENTVRGLAMPDGRVYLVAENISTLDEGRFVLFHETYGHIGMRAFLGDGYDLQMRTLRQANPALAKEADAWFKLYGEDEIAARIKAGFAPLKARQMVNALAVEEALADRAGTLPELKGWKRLMAALQRGLRRLGLGSVADMLEGMTEAETLDLLVNARRTVQRGQMERGLNIARMPAYQRVWHGTPYRGIEQFSTDAIGTGEGAQAYGWGLYFAGRKEIAEHYRKTLTSNPDLPAAENTRKALRDALEAVDFLGFDSWQEAARTIRQEGFANYDATPAEQARITKALREFDDARKGQLYEVDIPEDSEMLLWDKPLSEQPAKVREALYAMPGQYVNFAGARVFYESPKAWMTGQQVYKNRSIVLGSDMAASKALQAAGIRGIKYLDGTSRNAGDGTYNYVIFDGADAKIQGALFSRRTDQTQTPEFKRWFGDSKVVDAEGKPLVVYHVTDDNFSVFDLERLGSTTDANTGGDSTAIEVSKLGFWSHERALHDEMGKDVAMPLFYAIENPAIVNLRQLWSDINDASLRGEDSPAEAVRAMYESDGYDGLTVYDEEFGGRSFVAFRPEQIKSAIGNTGTFDPTNADIRFSRRTSQDILNSGGGVQDFSRYGTTKQDRIRGVTDKAREFWLGALTRDQIADVYGGQVPQVREYDGLVRSMENERSSLAQRADDLYQRWAKLDAETNDKLGRIMLDATTEQVHPDSDDAPADKTKAQIHAKLRAQFKLLPPEAQAMYREVRGFHAGVLKDIKDALIGRIERQVAAGAERAALLSKVQKQFDQYLENGPYFPLSRFGDYLVIATRPDGERVVAAYENSGEQQAAARELRKDGFTTKLKTAKEYARSQDGSAGKFIGDVIQAVEKVDMVEATINGSRSDLKNQLLDDLNQLFIRSLPDLSYRKHFAHRKNTPGFSADVMRGFASSAFHAASYIARLNHADKMTMGLQSAYEAIDQASSGDFNTQSQVLNELSKRHEAMLNPNTHPLSALATQVGFVMHLGLSPAAGLINMLQVPMVTIPYLGARHGFAKASAAMGKAYADIMKAPPNAQSGFNAAQSLALSAEERQAISTLQDEGVIDLTQAHDLAAATDRDVGDLAKNKTAFAMARAMRIVGWTFHVPEVMNRQTTALMAYRLEREKGASHEAALEAARETIKRTQFDYSSSNRARYMQGNIARVVLQFKQFSQNMTYFLGRAAYQALKGESPEVRKIARRQILSTFVVTGAMAGSLGLPGVGAAMGLVGLLVGAMDDADEPWDWQTEYRNMLTDQFGKEWGEVFAKGVPRMLMPGWDIAGRVSLSDLWWRSNDREGQNPRESFASDMANILGPTAGTLLSWYVAADHMERGQYDKAVEAVVPKFIRDPLKAYREADEGVTSYNGDPLMDVEAVEVLGRALGFAPARVSEMYEGRNAVMNTKTALEEKRQRLLNAVVKARLDGDREAEAEARSEVAGFNSRNPDFRITNMTIARSIATRRRNRDNTEQGILLPDTKADLRERARFANVE